MDGRSRTKGTGAQGGERMPTVLDLDAYRNGKNPIVPEGLSAPAPAGKTPPRISDAAIWSLDYTTFEGVVAGLLTIRTICDYHLHFNEEWKHYLLVLLDKAYSLHATDQSGDLVQETVPLKGYLAEETSPANRKEMEIAVLMLDLIARRYVRSAPACGGKGT